MIKDLVDNNDIILKQQMPKFDFSDGQLNPVSVYTDLAETMIHNSGVGLAANQIGIRTQAFVLTGVDVLGVFNPRIVDVSDETILLEEGCLSYTNLFVKIKRPKKIKARFTLPNGETVTRTFDGLTARAFQHEMDHLNGVVYTSRSNRYHLDQAKKLVKKIQRKYPIKPYSELSDEAKEMLDWLKT